MDSYIGQFFGPTLPAYCSAHTLGKQRTWRNGKLCFEVMGNIAAQSLRGTFSKHDWKQSLWNDTLGNFSTKLFQLIINPTPWGGNGYEGTVNRALKLWAMSQPNPSGECSRNMTGIKIYGMIHWASFQPSSQTLPAYCSAHTLGKQKTWRNGKSRFEVMGNVAAQPFRGIFSKHDWK